nr:uncharacterized protein LOC131756007 isoform X2 [Kogia breviceps]
MDTEWRAAPHTGAKGRGYPGPKRRPTLTGPGRKTAVLEACLTQPGPLGADWLPTRPWPPPGCPTVGQLGHPGLHLSLRVPVGTGWPRLAHGGGAGTSGSESSMNEHPEIGPRVTCPVGATYQPWSLSLGSCVPRLLDACQPLLSLPVSTQLHWPDGVSGSPWDQKDDIPILWMKKGGMPQ